MKHTALQMSAVVLAGALAACQPAQDPKAEAAAQAAAQAQAAEEMAKSFEAEYGKQNWELARAHGDVLMSKFPASDAAARIEEAAIDILVDLNGFSRVTRLAVAAQRPAPIQVAWFNLYATSGMTCFDYLIGDDQVVAPDEESSYTETIVRVPGSCLTFRVSYPVPDVADPPALTSGYVTFGCLASQYKITPPVVETWARILRRSPRAKLLLKNAALAHGANREHLADRFSRHGVTIDRLVFEGPAEHCDFLAAYSRIDVALDTFPYNGGTTTSEALWQGVPVLAFRGDRWASRTSASILVAAGLDEWVAEGVDDYVARAVGLASDPRTPERLGTERRDMRPRLLTSRVCDTYGFARAMEAIYRRLGQPAGAGPAASS